LECKTDEFTPNIEGMKGNAVLHCLFIMFGMSDPNQTLLQLESYVKDGRLEMSEVMATQFTDMFISMKKKDLGSQLMLVKGLRILCDVLLIRKKAIRAIASAKTLLRERKKLTSMIKSSDSMSLDIMRPIFEDYRRCANVFAAANKNRAAKKYYSKCERDSPGNIAVALEAFGYYSDDKKIIKRLLNCITSAGPVIRSNGNYVLQPLNLPPAPAHEVSQALSLIGEKGISEAVAQSERIIQEMGAIERGEAAANVRLQSALDSLKPKYDYHDYV
tara:strand:- start:326 stop:1147 length:822 start_codon:yes stop_codon:yes gene_type:complete